MYQTRIFRWLVALTILVGLYGGAYLQGQQPPVLVFGVDTATGIPHPLKVASDGSLGISASFSGAVAGSKTNNNAAPGATNIGALTVLANAAAPTWTEGNLVALSSDLTGALRISGGGGGGLGQGSTTSGQVGTLTMAAVTTAAPSYTTAQTSPFSLTTAGSLRVDVMNGGAGGLTVADNATFTDNVSSLTPAGGVAESATPTVCAEGKYCAAGMTLNRAQKVTLYDTAGTAITPSQDVTHNATVSATGPQIIAAGFSTVPTAVTTGNAVRAWAGLNGQLAVMLVDSAGAAVVTSTDYQQDAALTVATTTGGVVMGRASASAPTDVSADNDAVMAWFRKSGALVVSEIDPCGSETKTTDPFSLTARGIIIAATSGKKNYICGITIVAGAAEIFNLDEGTGTTCQTSTAALAGSVTAANGLSLAANGIFSAHAGNSTILAGKTANVDLCLVPSAANRLAGFVTWVQK